MNLGFFRSRSSEFTECFTSTWETSGTSTWEKLGGHRLHRPAVWPLEHFDKENSRAIPRGLRFCEKELAKWHLTPFFWEGTDFSSQWDRWNKSPATAWRSLVKVSFNWACLKTCQGFLPSQMEMNMNPAMSSIRIYGFVIVYTPLCLLVNYDIYIYIWWFEVILMSHHTFEAPYMLPLLSRIQVGELWTFVELGSQLFFPTLCGHFCNPTTVSNWL